MMDRFWLLSNTCYGTWLPGSRHGFVSQILEHRPHDAPDDRRVTHDLPGTAYDEDLPALEAAAKSQMRGPPIYLTTAHSEICLAQFQETARHRGWQIRAVAIMFNHFHIVLGVPGDPSPSKLLGDFKSWATRRLSATFGKPASETWWTERGSKRKLPNEVAVLNAIRYVIYDQPNPLLTWSPETGLHLGLPPNPSLASVEA